jgi:hypothetical protein
MSEGLANQIAASDPANSVWVVANAGSGKTYVLTSRIVRLLLAGARPAAILCLTFTKAAAAEMHARLSALLAGWATAPDAALDADLRQRLGQIPDEAVRRAARTLFARVIDAPGALRIQTIHAFCESLLKRFPVEARVPPHFSVADDGIGGELMDLARNQLLADAMDDAPLRVDGRDTWLLRQVDGFTLLAFGDAPVTPADLTGLPVPVKLLRLRPAGHAPTVAGEAEDVQGLAHQRLDARDGTVYLLRPDQHVAARWRAFDAAALRSALARALCQKAH